jgi:hypothetical protein
MMPDFDVSPFHQLIIDNLEFLLNGHIRKRAIITPPRHRRTTPSFAASASAGKKSDRDYHQSQLRERVV